MHLKIDDIIKTIIGCLIIPLILIISACTISNEKVGRRSMPIRQFCDKYDYKNQEELELLIKKYGNKVIDIFSNTSSAICSVCPVTNI